MVRRQFTNAFCAGAGFGYRVTRIDQDHTRPWEDNTLYGFAFIPVEASLDTRDNLLDPSRGVFTSLTLAPYFGTMAALAVKDLERAIASFHKALERNAVYVEAYLGLARAWHDRAAEDRMRVAPMIEHIGFGAKKSNYIIEIRHPGGKGRQGYEPACNRKAIAHGLTDQDAGRDMGDGIHESSRDDPKVGFREDRSFFAFDKPPIRATVRPAHSRPNHLLFSERSCPGGHG